MVHARALIEFLGGRRADQRDIRAEQYAPAEFKAAVAECTGDERERWQQTVAEAALVTKCLQQRNHTMRRLMEVLAQAQQEAKDQLEELTSERRTLQRELTQHTAAIRKLLANGVLKNDFDPDGQSITASVVSPQVIDRMRHLHPDASRRLIASPLCRCMCRLPAGLGRDADGRF